MSMQDFPNWVESWMDPNGTTLYYIVYLLGVVINISLNYAPEILQYLKYAKFEMP